MENVTSQGHHHMTFELDQHMNPEIIAYTRELFARHSGLDADKAPLRYFTAQARHYLHQINDGHLTHHQLQLARSRRQWLLHLRDLGDRRGAPLMRLYMARVIVDGAEHGGAHARSAGAPTGAALATPHE